MSKIRVNELVNQGNTGPTLAVEGLKIPTTKNLEIEGSIILNGNPGLNGQVLSRTASGLQWSSVPLTDNNTTYQVSAVDGQNITTEKVIKLSPGGSGGSASEVVLIAGNNVALSRNGSRITIDSSYVDTNTVTRLGVGGNYTDGDISFVGTGGSTVTQNGRIFTINSTDTNTTYSGVNGVSITVDNKIQIGQPVGPSDAVTFGQVTISGNLTVQGTTTYNNVQQITTLDKFIKLNDVLIPTDSAADGGGVILRGDTDHSILWSNSYDAWNISENLNLFVGREFQISGSSVLTATTLGPTVINSSLEGVGIVTSGRWEAQTLAIEYGGTGETTAAAALNALLPAQAGNAGKYLTSDGQDPSWGAIPATYAGWTLSDASTAVSIPSNSVVQFIATGSSTLSLDNTNRRITIDSTDTLFDLTVENTQSPSKKAIRLTDSNSNFDEVVLAAGTGITLTRTGSELEFSVAQDLSSSGTPTFAELTITGVLNAGSYAGDASGLSGLTGATSGTYGSSGSIPVITVDGNGRITSIATSPNTGAAGGGGIVAGGSTGSIQYNSSGGIAGSTKLQFEPSAGKLELTGTLDATTVQSDASIFGNLTVSDYIKLPSKTPSERNLLSVQNGTIIYNNSTNTVDIYKDGQWDIVGPTSVTQFKIGDFSDVSNAPPTQGQVLKWDGSAWTPSADTGGGGGGAGGVDLTAFSAFNLNPNGPGDLQYSSTNGVFLYTPPDLSSFLTSYTETDPVYSASPAANISNTKIANWDSAYTWGNHSTQGYLTNISSLNLDDLFNVASITPSDGQVLKWSDAQNKWAPASDLSGGGSNVDLTAFSVSTSSASAGGALQYNNQTGVFSFTPADVFSGSYNDLTNTPSLFSGNYNDLVGAPSIPTALGNLSDVSSTVSSATNNQVLTWSSGDNLWIPADPQGGQELDTLDSVTDRGATTSNSLVFGGLTISDDGLAPGSIKIFDHGGYSSLTFRSNSNGSDQGQIRGDENNLQINTANGLVSINSHAEFYANGDVVLNKLDAGSTPQGTLTVAGLAYPVADGSAGQVMTTDGQGNITFATVTSASTSSDLHDITVNGSTTSNTITVGGLDLTGTNHKIRLGPSSTFQLFYNGQDDEILTSGNNLRVRTINSDLVLGSTGGITKITVDASSTGDTLAQFINGGSVELYHNGTKRFETTAFGVQVPQELNVIGDLKKNGVEFKTIHLADVSNVTPSQGQVLKWDVNSSQWAPASDLTATGSGGIALTDLSVITATASGGGGLSYSNQTGTFTYTPAVVAATDTLESVTQRGATSSLRITTAGLTATDHIILGDNKALDLGDGATASDFRLIHTGTANRIECPNDHNLIIGEGTAGSNNRAVFNDTGSVELYFNGTKRFETSNTGATVIGELQTTGGNSQSWNTAYGWGDHSGQGYLTSISGKYINELADVAAGASSPGPTTGQLMTWNGSEWAAMDAPVQPTGVEIGMIIIWSGSVSNIPTGWALCNGQTVNGQVTPDLRDRFVVGAGLGTGNAGDLYSPGDTGGNKDTTLTTAQLPSHSHGINDPGHTHTMTGGAHDHGLPSTEHSHVATVSNDSHSHGGSSDTYDHSHGLTDYGHSHSVSDSGHGHNVSDGGHNHGTSGGSHSHNISGGSHNHNVSDPGHAHSYAAGQVWGTAAGGGGNPGAEWGSMYSGASFGSGVNASNTGINIGGSGNLSINCGNANPGININSSNSSISVSSSGTGISLGSNTTGLTMGTDSHTHTITLNAASTGITVTNADAGIGISQTDEATPSITANNATTGITALNTGSGSTIDNRPPYYALCYIMRVSSTGGGGGGGGGGGSARVTTDDTPPSTPADGDLWWNSTDGRLKIYYQDPDGYQWVDASPPLSQTDYIKLTELKSVVAASSDFADFQSRIAAL